MSLTLCQSADVAQEPVFPLGSRARVLLSSVFGPYAQDDEYGSRLVNPMELHHNQVTRVQGPFSLRMCHRSWGLLLIQANISAPCTCLDFPTLERFEEELRHNPYDVIGISSIICNVGKVKKMCELIRQHQPKARIVIGGHIANMPDLADLVDADYLVHGEGIRWFRHFLGEDEEQPIRHPLIHSGSHRRTMGISLPGNVDSDAAALIPSVGCPMGCNFCSTSHMFGGKGKFVNFYETGDELFDVMCQLESAMKIQSFFIMDENFLLYRQRTLRLLELMEKNNKSWALAVFSSANALKTYTMEQLVSLGIEWIWMGLEGASSQYSKLDGTDTHALVRKLQSHGIRILGSSIIGLEEHTPQNIDAAIEHAISHETEFHQFMLYTPTPGTPLHRELSAKGLIMGKDEFDDADTHGQSRFNYRHPNIPAGEEGELLLRAFNRDFDVNGPSVMRIVRTTLAGWKRYKNHPSGRIRERFAREMASYPTMIPGALWAARRWFRSNPVVAGKLDVMLQDVYREFGLRARICAPIVGRILSVLLKREAKRLKAGWTREPITYYDRNEAAAAQAGPDATKAGRMPSVVSRVVLAEANRLEPVVVAA